ncbi:50S ribosomal protein L14e [Candidatus Micrarchaeota archaeon]|nr:50S ribosomal protein L14e [Candidatus Micrarchaeota archaeon]
MVAMKPGRICVVTMGRDAGKKAIVTKMLEGNFAEISIGNKKRRSSVRHLEPTNDVASV